jgi:hypothetical protein
VIRTGVDWDRPVPTRTWIVLAVVALGAFLLTAALPERDSLRYGLAFVLGAELAFLGWVAPRRSILVIFGWLIVLGTTRRLVSWSAVDLSPDPLLLVGPAGLATLSVQAWRAGALRRWSVLSVMVAALSVVALFEVFNSRQGPVRAGLVGLLFWLVPMLWFWVGRAFGDRRLMTAVYGLFAAACVVIAFYGLGQSFVGFPAWDRQWITDHGYAALFIGNPFVGGSRPFGFASSAVEYSLTVALGVFLVLLFLGGAIRRGSWGLAAVLAAGAGVCTVALAVSGFRTAIVTLFVALVASALLRWRPSVPVVLLLLGVILASYAALWVVNVDSWSGDGTVGQMRRAVVGLRNPFNAGDSTLPDHIRIARRGLERGWHEPLGSGTGTTLHSDGAGYARFVLDTEFDVSNGAVAFGLVGILLTGAMLLWGLGLAAARAWRRPDLVHLAAFGVLVISFRFWWNGGHYALAPLLWFGLGWVDAAGPYRRGRGRARVSSYASARS